MRKPLPHQTKAISELHNGSVLVGSTGSGKSFVALSYFYEKILGGSFDPPIFPSKKVNLIVITTAIKRDNYDWDKEASLFAISKDKDLSINNIEFIVDSWNNIKKYSNFKNCFFIFDEQKVINNGVWVKTFIKITKNNRWILLTATPADRWIDLAPLFIANGFYKNKTDFTNKHVIYDPHVTFPKIKAYLNTNVLINFKNKIFVLMEYEKKTKVVIKDINVSFDSKTLKECLKNEWNPFKNKPVRNLSEHGYVLRRIVNQDTSRIIYLSKLQIAVRKLIIFYNFDYELEILKKGFGKEVLVGEYNGHKHDKIPLGNNWVYLVQYLSGNEAWECFETNHMAFYSLNHSYRITLQSMGRIDRMNTIYDTVYYYRLISDSFVDKFIIKSFQEKKDFNIKDLKILFSKKEYTN